MSWLGEAPCLGFDLQWLLVIGVFSLFFVYPYRCALEMSAGAFRNWRFDALVFALLTTFSVIAGGMCIYNMEPRPFGPWLAAFPALFIVGVFHLTPDYL